MDVTWSAIISGIALIVAILSPICTTVITNRHQLKIRELEFYLEYKAKAVEAYIQNTGTVLKHGRISDLGAYGKSFGEIFMYASDTLWDDIERIDLDVRSRAITQQTNDLFTKVCKSLAEKPPRSKPNRRQKKNETNPGNVNDE